MQEFGRPGTLLGLLPDLELHDSRSMLRASDSLITFTDGVTEARSHIDRDLYGDDRLRGLIAGLGDMSAARMAEAIQQATLSFGGGKISDDSCRAGTHGSLARDERAARVLGAWHAARPRQLRAAGGMTPAQARQRRRGGRRRWPR